MGSLSRRQLLVRGGAGLAALATPGLLAACDSGDESPPAAAGGDPWKRFSGTTLNFISENTAPTLAIGANLEPFRELTGIEIKITQLELSALVQRVALDFASGLGSYQVVYADPYQILAPYREALTDLNEFMDDGDLPQPDKGIDDFIQVQLDAAGRFEDPEGVYALPYDAPTMIWMYRRDILEKHRRRMQQDLGFDPLPSDQSTWQRYYETARWLNENARDDVPFGTGHQAKQHDSLMNDFSNILWSYGGDYFKDGEQVGRLGMADPGEPQLDQPEAIEAADFYRRLLDIAHPGSTGWDWTGAAEAFMAGQLAMMPNWHEFAAGIEGSDYAGKVGYHPLPKGPAREANMYGGTGLGINRVAPKEEQQAAWLFLVWATNPDTQLMGLKSDVGGGTPTRTSVYELPEVKAARKPPSKLKNILTADAVFEAWRPDKIGLRPKIPAWNACDTAIFTELSNMLAGSKSPEEAMRSASEGFAKAIDNAEALSS